MRRINIKHKDTMVTKSFETKGKFIKFLRGNEMFLFSEVSNNVFDIADNVWNLNVGSGTEFFGFRFAIQSKARVGNQLVL